MMAFFRKAFQRDCRKRFDNSEEMGRAWEKVFETLDQITIDTLHPEEFDREAAVRSATHATNLIRLGLSPLAANALDRINAITVLDLLQIPLRRIHRLLGVGSKTRKEIAELVYALRNRFPSIPVKAEEAVTKIPGTELGESRYFSIDTVVRNLRGTGGRDQNTKRMIRMFIGLEETDAPFWPGHTDMASCFGLTNEQAYDAIRSAVNRWRKMPMITRVRDTVLNMLESVGGVTTVGILSGAILTVCGSVEKEPLRSQFSAAVIRAAVEVEKGNRESRFIYRRNNSHVIIALNDELAGYADELGHVADRLAKRDPLASPSKVIEAFRSVHFPPGNMPLSDTALIKLGAGVSDHAAVSSRMEIYPKKMSGTRALRLAQGALYSTRPLTAEDIQDRVSGRYPEAENLPGRPELDELLREAGLELEWFSDIKGKGGYQSMHGHKGLSTGSTSLHRISTDTGIPGADVTSEMALARLFERKLRSAEKEGAFLVVSVPPQYLLQAEAELLRRFDLDCRNMDEVFIRAMREQAETFRVKWDVVCRADAADHETRDWKNLQTLVGRCMPLIEKAFSVSDRTILLTFPGLLARYDQMGLLERLRDSIGFSGSMLHGLWVLIPADDQSSLPVLDGRPIPVLSPAQNARISKSWLENVHRG